MYNVNVLLNTSCSELLYKYSSRANFVSRLFNVDVPHNVAQNESTKRYINILKLVKIIRRCLLSSTLHISAGEVFQTFGKTNNLKIIS